MGTKQMTPTLQLAVATWISKVETLVEELQLNPNDSEKLSKDPTSLVKLLDTQWVVINEPRNVESEDACEEVFSEFSKTPCFRALQDNPFVKASFVAEFTDSPLGRKQTRYRFRF